MVSQIPERKAANTPKYTEKFTGSVNTPEVYGTKHVIDSDDSQQNETPTDVQDIHF